MIKCLSREKYKNHISNRKSTFESIDIMVSDEVILRNEKTFFQRDDVPRSTWKLDQYKKFCEEHKLTVVAEHGKQAAKGKLVLNDYKKSANEYADKMGLKYRADTIIESYGFITVRLPPYHPELNAIGKFKTTCTHGRLWHLIYSPFCIGILDR